MPRHWLVPSSRVTQVEVHPLRILVGKHHPVARSARRRSGKQPGQLVRPEIHDEAELLQRALEKGADAIVLGAERAAVGKRASGNQSGDEPTARTLVLCLHPGSERLESEAVVATACAFFLSTSGLDAVERVVAETHAGGCPRVAVPRAPGLAAASAGPPGDLSPRETLILTLLAQEKTSKEIAGVLGLSARTVDAYRSGLMKKLRVQSTVGLACYAIGAGLVGP